MTPEQWSVVNRIFHDAADRTPAERGAYVQHESGGDLTIQAAVTELLRADSHRGNYLSLPAAAMPEFQSLLLSPAGSTTLLQSGDLLCERFQIVRQLGEGGMGQVYEALDQELQVRVALKVIQPEIAALEGMTNRFRHEVRLARSITHPNICRTFDLERGAIADAAGISRDLIFLTMEYLEGETLAVRLARSAPLSLHDAMTIAGQLAEGIEAAHRHGVVHRDLKPQNVLLARAENSDAGSIRVVIMDFGLARLNPASFALTQKSATSQHGQVAGTFTYMAPEQIGGGPALPASDIYSFGLILFEMVTGAKAFPPESFLPDLGRRLGDHPPSPRKINPSLPAVWEAVIARCLARRPEDRFTAAGQVIDALHNGLPIHRRVYTLAAARLRRQPPRFFLRIAAAAIVLLSVALSSFVPISRFTKTERMNGTVPLGALVYMPPVKNQTSNPRLSQVTQMMRVTLAQSSRIAVLDEAQEADTLQRMVRPLDTAIDAATAREIAMRTGVRRIVLVTLTEENALLHLLVSVQQPEASNPNKPRLHIDRSWTCGAQAASTAEEIPADLLHIVRDASDWVRQTAGEANEDIVNLNAPVEDLTTSNWGAFTAYTRGDRLQQQGRSSDAVLALAEAVRLDPGFALAYARMGDILFSIARSAEGLDAYRKALDTGEQRRLTRRERDRIRGQYAIDTWDFQAAESVFRDATIYYERDYLSWFYRGSTLIYMDRLPEAVATLRQAATLRPGEMSAPFALASALFIENDAEGALRQATHLASSGHPDAAWWLQAEDQWLRGRWEEADSTLGRITGLPSSSLSSFAWDLRVRLAVDRDQTKTARNLLTQGMDADKQTGSISQFAEKQLDLAYLECAASEYTPCFADLEAALRSTHDPRSFRTASEVLSRALRQHPPAPVDRQIQSFFHRLLDDAPGNVYGLSAEIVRNQLRGDLLLSQHKVAEAVRVFRKIAVLDPPAEANLRLARSLGRAAETENHPAYKRVLFAEAAQAYGSLEKSGPYLWYSGNFLPPSFAFEAKQHLKLAGSSNIVVRPQGPP